MPETVRLPESEGEAAGISYRIRGAGPPLLLMPLELAPSQWAPLLPPLAQHYSIIELGGAYRGTVALLEARGRSIPCGNVRPFDPELLKQLQNPFFKRKNRVRSHGSVSLPRWTARTKPGGEPATVARPSTEGKGSPIAARFGIPSVTASLSIADYAAKFRTKTLPRA